MAFFNISQHQWHQFQKITNKSFKCGYCGDKVASDRGYRIGENSNGTGAQRGGIYICPNCNGPNFNDLNSNWHPGHPFGRNVENVPKLLNDLYEESRKCHKENCFTASVLLCRKMLMNIAVEQGAKPNLQFIKYVKYLSENGFIPPNGKKWVDHIRKKGNEATHEIDLMTENDSKDLISFTEMMLVFLYEFPSRIPDIEEEGKE
ncbi:DUF4145 domain-containing protein [Flagellimonas profundi]|uniref:DUF4145 domain-containing protein n=1 Tax=Flagellimonas profundi TaxID=2915620 RepID=A0ABS3FB67_9FLAO|nr:DUF4145 domain-containing protein [Allomuricauda profundi]MBO0340207.1 DUF4145 domain-containing protein [Allomuricauda profundi]